MPRKLQAAARAHAAGRQLAALSPSDLGGRPLKPLKEPVKGTSGSGLSVGAKNRVKTPTLPPIAPAPAAADAVSELTSKVEKLTRELSTETARSGRLQTALEQAEQAVAELRSKLDTSRSCTRCDALQTDQLKASARIAELEAYLQQQQQRAAAAEQENDPTTTSTHAEELEELQAQAATEKASLERRLEVLEVELQEAVAAAAVAAAAPAAATSASESEAAAAREAELRAEIESLREQSDAALAAEREDRAADLARRTKDWTAQLQELRDSLSASDAARSDAETRLQLEQAALLASETRCEELAAKVTSAEQAESASSSTEAEMGQVQEKLEKQKRISQRLRDDHATAVLTWQKNTEELSAELRRKQTAIVEKDRELRLFLTSTEKERDLLKSLEKMFDDDSYESCLVEELGAMRERFQLKLDKLTEQCKDAERRVGEAEQRCAKALRRGYLS